MTTRHGSPEWRGYAAETKAVCPVARPLAGIPESVVRSRNVFKRNSLRFAAALLVALTSLVAGPNAALAAAPQRHDQVPGFYRLKVGDLEVTALFDGSAVVDTH